MTFRGSPLVHGAICKGCVRLLPRVKIKPAVVVQERTRWTGAHVGQIIPEGMLKHGLLPAGVGGTVR